MPRRIAIISDTHFGPSRARLRAAAQLEPIWRFADELIINGDAAEIHHPLWRGRAARQLLALQDRCEEAGVRLTLLSGNHDPLLSDERHRLLGGGQVLVMHGDAVHPALAPWSMTATRIRVAHEQALAALTEVERRDLRARLSACQHAAHGEWVATDGDHRESGCTTRTLLRLATHPWLVWRIIRAWSEFPGLTADFARRFAPTARFVVVGHTHRPTISRLGDRIVINTGSFTLPGPPRLVLVERDRLCIHAVRRRRRCYEPMPRPIASFELATTARSSDHLPQPDPAAVTCD